MLLDEEIEPSTSVAKTQIFVLIKLGGTVNGFSIEDAAEEQELMALTNAVIESEERPGGGALLEGTVTVGHREERPGRGALLEGSSERPGGGCC